MAKVTHSGVSVFKGHYEVKFSQLGSDPEFNSARDGLKTHELDNLFGLFG